MIRQELQRVNAMQPSLSGDELLSLVIASHSGFVLTRRLKLETEATCLLRSQRFSDPNPLVGGKLHTNRGK